MSRRLRWKGMPALGLLSLVVCGSAVAAALPRASAAHKHRRKATKCSSFRAEGGPLVGPVTMKSGTPPATFAEYGVTFSCNGAVSAFSVTSNKPFVPRSVAGADAIEVFIGSGVPAGEHVLAGKVPDDESGVCREKGSSTFRCTFPAPKRPPRSVHVTADFFSGASCSTPMFGAHVSVIGKTNAVKTQCVSG